MLNSEPGKQNALIEVFPGLDGIALRDDDPDEVDVLIVEGDAAQRSLITQILERKKLVAVGWENGLEAMEWLDNALAPPRVILCDLDLPGLGGVEFYMMLLQSAEWYSIPVVLMTANPTRENMKNLRALPVPPDYLLCKPFRPDMLVQIMETILKQDHPLCILRDLQRRKLNVQRKMLQIRKAMEDQAPADAAKIERARSIIITMTNKLISLKRERTQAVNLYADPSLDLDEKIKSLGTEIAQIEAFIKGHEDQRKSQLERKRELLLVSKSLEEIDRKIQVLNKTIAKEGILDLRSPSKMGKEMLDWLASGSGGG